MADQDQLAKLSQISPEMVAAVSAELAARRLKTLEAAVMMKIWDRVEQTLVGVLGLAALAFALWQVVSRYFVPQQSISYAEEVIVYLLIWAIMIVSSQLVRTDGHVRPDLVLNVVPASVARWVEMFNCARRDRVLAAH